MLPSFRVGKLTAHCCAGSLSYSAFQNLGYRTHEQMENAAA